MKHAAEAALSSSFTADDVSHTTFFVAAVTAVPQVAMSPTKLRRKYGYIHLVCLIMATLKTIVFL